MTSLKYPIGKYSAIADPSGTQMEEWLEQLTAFPAQMRDLVKGITPEKSRWRYRPEGWSIAQVVHHCADSHLNSYTRFRLALTEEQPHIKPYHEDRWAELPDAQMDDLSDSLLLLHALHRRWVYLLRSLTADQWGRTFQHPEHGEIYSLKETLGQYAWHGLHHLAHVRQALASAGEYGSVE